MGTHVSLGVRERGHRASRGNATRYLCVGAEIDPDFADKVVEAVIERRYQAVAPSFGIDLAWIAWHALNGRRRRTTRNLLLTGLAVLNLVLNPVVTIITAASWLMTRFAYRAAQQRWPGRRSYALGVGAVTLFVVGGFLGLLLLLPVLLALSAASFAPAFGGGGTGSPNGLLALGGLSVLITPSSVVVAFGLLLGGRLNLRSLLVKTLRWDTFNPDARKPVADSGELQRLAKLAEIQRQNNVTVYSGKLPFIGAGDPFQTWSFAIDLSRGAAEGAQDGAPQRPVPFGIGALYGHVGTRLEALRSEDLDPAQRLTELMVEDRLFVNGGYLHGRTDLLPDPRQPPVAWVDPDLVEATAGDPHGPIRHFKCMSVGSWGQEVVLSVFLHFATDGRTLYVEQTACLLPPVRPEYRIVDGLTVRMLPGELGANLWAALMDLPSALLRAPVELWRGMRSKRREQRQDDVLKALMDERMPIDYGASISVRELGAAAECDNWFQELDARKYLRVIELQVLNAILDFLEDHGVDTAEFRARQTAILNSTTINQNWNNVSGTINQANAPGATANLNAASPAPGPTPGGANPTPAGRQ